MTSEEARTPAFIVFEQNMAHVGFVQDSLIKGTAEAVPLIQSLQKQIEAIKELGKEEKPPVVEAVVTQLAEISTKYFGGLNFVREWMSVMLMTFLRAYLEESLVGIAVRDADVMARVRKMEAVQVDPRWSHDEARRIWAERALSGTGPKKWFKYFEDEGVKNYGEVDISNAQHLFDTRNRIVHAAGKPSDDYVRQYPKQMVLGGQIKVTQSNTLLWSGSAWNLVKATDAFMSRVQT
jgi:hypothetical protein